MRAPVLQRLLKYPHAAVFDKSPQAELAMRVRSNGGLTWAVADEVLTLSIASGTLTYDLSTLTVGQLAAALAEDGIEVSTISGEFAGLSATVLVEGTGDIGKSNGDRLTGFKSLLWSLYSSYAKELRVAGRQIPEALKQMVITSSEGEWLDLWGSIYGVARPAGRSDEDYAADIPKEAFRIRVNGLAIEQAILDITGKDVRIEEPWRLMFRLDTSALSGSHHMQNQAFYRPHIIQPTSVDVYDMADVMAVIERNRAAGIIVAPPLLRLPTWHVSFGDEFTASLNRLDTYVIGAWSGGEIPLGVMRLDNNRFNFNHEVQAYQIIAVSNSEGLQEEQNLGLVRSIAVASVALSAGPRLGDQNAILSRGEMHVLLDPKPIISASLKLSDYDRIEQINLVEKITTDRHDISYNDQLAGTVSDNTFHVRAFYISRIGDEAYWKGSWDDRMWAGARVAGMTVTHINA